LIMIVNIWRCIQKFPDSLLGPRTSSTTAFCH
jgi:hypothetical protein